MITQVSDNGVLIITYDWPPSADVGAVRVEKIAGSLNARGIKPVILTTRESNYERVFREKKTFAFPVIRTREVPSPLKAYKYLKSLILKTRGSTDLNGSGNKSQRSSAQTSESIFRTSYLKRLVLSLFFMPDEFQGWLPFAVLKAMSVMRARHISRVITSGPPFTTHLVGLAIKKWKGDHIKWIADFRDPWVANEQRTELVTTAVSNYFNRLLEKQVVTHADHVVCVTPSMTDWYRKRYPLVPDSAWHTITNGFEREEFNLIHLHGEQRKFTMSYIGSIEYERSPVGLLKAVAELCQERVLDREQVSIRFVGKCGSVQGGPTTEIIQECGLKGAVELVGLVPRSEALKEMKEAHVLLLLANAQHLQVPGKAYEYIGAGSFILAVTEEHGATADFVRRIGGGAIVPPGDHKAMKAVLADRYEQFVKSSSALTMGCGPVRSAAILNEYEWSQLGARYAEILR
jgi:glycosyltransferase involved in cell wall biosynthesis